MPEEKETDSTVTMDKVNEAIESALKPIKELLTGDSNTSGDSEKEERDTRRNVARERARTRTRTLRDIETQAEQLVQSEVAKVFSEKEHEQEHKKLEAERSKKETENPPLKKKWLTELLVGKGYHEGTMK
jgi:hypothetical protein